MSKITIVAKTVVENTFDGEEVYIVKKSDVLSKNETKLVIICYEELHISKEKEVTRKKAKAKELQSLLQGETVSSAKDILFFAGQLLEDESIVRLADAVVPDGL